MDNRDRTNGEVYESETDSGHREPEEVEEERPKPVFFRIRQEPRFNQIKLRQKKQYQMRRV